ncbi:PorP/SprF family type IX secretion system membrane protein [Psychroflexus halocasei]|uniref:Type IX secretion system membrane protein, PorP/SprF family n=1 Tax=Psychroflexus halocasei TaxID=908615 RepID=A0A1H3WRJ4_9FLAO|nr:type IX secretion system membrane protein PorP/SprF [Psychroflexus halocasei]SDZ89765.1 type IX secretion system membrane protein, PorP/SprF family [Psychroflexus halocasei]
MTHKRRHINCFYLSLVFFMGLLFNHGNIAFAQQDPNFTQYMYNTMSINPAYAGSRDVLSATILHRSQWLGFDDGPQTQTLTAHSPLKKENMGLGLSVVHDKIGIASDTYINGVYSYSIDVSRFSKITFGLNAGINMLNVDFNKLNIEDNTDPIFQNNIDNKLSPQFGLGILLNNDQYYVGISSPALLATDHFEGSSDSKAEIRDRVHYYLTSGVVLDLSNTVRFKPSILIRHVSGSPLMAELSTNFLFNNKFTVGAAYRYDSAFSGLFAFQASDSILLGLSYDSDITEFSAHNNGSLEVFLRFELFKRYKKMYTPRFF